MGLLDGLRRRRAQEDPMAAVTRAERYSRSSDVAKAEEIYLLVAETGHPEAAPMAQLRLGMIRRRRQDPRGAEDMLRRAIHSGHPEHAPVAIFTLGAVLTDAEQSAAAYQSALDTGHPDVAASAAICLGEVREDQQRFDDAAAAYQAAIDLGDRRCTVKAQLSLGRLHRDQGRTEAGDALLRQVAASDEPEAAHMARRMLDPAIVTNQFSLTFPAARGLGKRIQADRMLLDAILMEEGRPDLVGRDYVGGWTSNGDYVVKFPSG